MLGNPTPACNVGSSSRQRPCKLLQLLLGCLTRLWLLCLQLMPVILLPMLLLPLLLLSLALPGSRSCVWSCGNCSSSSCRRRSA